VSDGVAGEESPRSDSSSDEHGTSMSSENQLERVEVVASMPGSVARSVQEFVLEVVLPVDNPHGGQSGVQAVMGEHSLQDVEGFFGFKR
jgi:hypothetical protein